MSPRSTLLWHFLLCGTLLLAVACPAQAAVQLQAAKVGLPGITLNQVQVDLQPGSDGAVQVNLSAARADISAVGWRRVGVDVHGALTRGGAKQWQFVGTVKLKNAPGGLLGDAKLKLAMDIDANNLNVDVTQGKGQASAEMPLDQLTHLQIRMTRLPLTWLQGLLARVWSGHLTAGRVDGTLAVDVRDDGVRTSGNLALSGAGFDSPGGSLAGQGLGVRGRARLDTTAKPAVLDVDLNLHGGELLLGPLYAHLPGHDVRLALTAHGRDSGVDLDNLQFSDPDAMQLSGSIGLADDGSVRSIDSSHFNANLATAYTRYGKAWLDALGFPGLKVTGRLQGQLTMTPAGLRAFAFDADHVDVSDSAHGLAVADLNGGLDWRAGGTRPATTLGWKSLHIYAIPNGAASGHWQTHNGVVKLQQPLRVPVLGGQLIISSLDWSPAADKGERLQTSLVLTDVDMSALSRAFGWPQFKGTLAGAVPGLTYTNDRFQLDGGLSLNVFGGFVNVTRMSLQQPFGDTPVLVADVTLQQLNLAAITQVFDFGSITGSMHGSIDDLRLVDWSPVAFKAHLLADQGGRISQRAVGNLTSVGGGGVAGGLQGAVLKLFKSFGYDRIGLSCTLQGKVCHMDGLKDEGDGFLIVDGRGLPHLTVIGHEHTVSWPTLIDRLEAAISGDGPIVE